MTEYGWHTNKSTKPLMIDELAKSIRDESLDLRCAGALGEMRTYVRDERGAMGGSPHDDRVMALAIANQMIGFAFAPEYKEESNDYWTVNWWANLQPGGETFDSEWKIGAHSVRR